MKLAIFMSLLLIGSACTQVRPIQQQHTVTDTVYVDRTVTERDTLFITKRATVEAVLQWDSMAVEKAVQRTVANATLTLRRLADGRLHATAECDSLAIAAKIRDTLLKETRSRTATIITEVPVKYTPAWVKALAYVGGATALSAAIFILIKIAL